MHDDPTELPSCSLDLLGISHDTEKDVLYSHRASCRVQISFTKITTRTPIDSAQPRAGHHASIDLEAATHA